MSSGKDESSAKIVLPKSVKPERYDITLNVSMEPDFKFKGNENITLNILEKNINTIIFNSVELEIPFETITLTYPDSEVVKPSKIDFDTTLEMCTLTFDNALKVGKAVLTLDFSAELSKTMSGFYLTSFKNESGEQSYIGVTQFEASDARRAFPCWDEPEIKAIFKLTITAPEKYSTLSNMHELRETISEDGKTKTHEFEETPLMSSYLLAYVIGNFDHVEGYTKKGVLVRVFTRPGRGHLGNFALKTAINVLDYYAEYFGIDYPFKKYDNVGIPNFSAGAMENWGLVTYREARLLIDEEKSSIPSKLSVAYAVTHEAAHQWFGNLVTMKWWDDIWLNEGFATYMEKLSADYLYPQWETWKSYAAGDFMSALTVDALTGTHPIHIPINKPSDLQGIFDVVTYSKGSAMIRMLATFIGPEKMRDGLRLYLSRFLYGNTQADDLWQALSDVSGNDIKEMMDSWILHPGYPLLSVSRTDDSTLTITRRRMYSSGKSDDKGFDWDIPVSILSNDPQLNKKSVHFNTEMYTIKVENKFVDNLWVKFNFDQTSILRVIYDRDIYDTLAEAIKKKEIPVIDRIGILGDAVSLAEAGYIPTSIALKVIESFENEDDFAVWSSISSSLNKLLMLTASQDKAIYSRIAGIAGRITIPMIKKLGWDVAPGEDDQTSRLRAVVLGLAEAVGNEEVISEALRRFEHPETIAVALKPLVYRVAAKADEEHRNKLLEMFRATDIQENRLIIIRALGAVSQCGDDALLRKYLDWAIYSGDVLPQDIYYPFGSAGAGNPDFTINYLMENWDKVYGVCKTTFLFIMSEIFDDSVAWAHSRTQLDAIEKFFSEKDDVDTISSILGKVYETVTELLGVRESIMSMLRASFNCHKV